MKNLEHFFFHPHNEWEWVGEIERILINFETNVMTIFFSNFSFINLCWTLNSVNRQKFCLLIYNNINLRVFGWSLFVSSIVYWKAKTRGTRKIKFLCFLYFSRKHRGENEIGIWEKKLKIVKKGRLNLNENIVL